VEQGLIASFARPGGNVTGVAFFTGAELGSKLVETFREVAPHVTRISALVTPSAASIVQGGQYLTEAGTRKRAKLCRHRLPHLQGRRRRGNRRRAG
jgi:ABC-type uncharacterized transport system substrate-binding protein